MIDPKDGKDEPVFSQTPSRPLCPFVNDLSDECLLAGTASENAEAAIRLCGGKFESCEVYRRRRWNAEPKA